jgi:uridine phosphorylase
VPAVPDLNEALTRFRFERPATEPSLRIANYEMETSALYGLSGLLGHRACTVCAVVANRLRKEYTKDHHVAVERMIDMVLERVAG